MPKNIILLSDGTGNSAAKLFKTNVWRIYESLDLTDPHTQVACYDDGVGTSTFLPLQLLGGALGFGLKRNVLRLYRFLCEHYEPGDRIYAFGFSRGAFTVRVLVGLVLDQGVIRVRPAPQPHEEPAEGEDGELCDVINGGELRRYARWAYRRFRRVFDQTGLIVELARAMRDSLFRTRDKLFKYAPYDDIWRIPVEEIEFLGLWDTVDAYGLPLDEMTAGIDRWLFPLTMPDQVLSPRVRKACHALAIDDERQTFHPVLWDEATEPQDAANIDDERITQVWFAGAHANVGGGYPNDALSLVSLDWMAGEAKKREVRFIKDALTLTTAKRDVFGRSYDSRRGLAASYRYMPRPIRLLTNGQTHEQGFFKGTWPRPSPTVTIGRPKIHESVFARIYAGPEAYAPIGLPESYAVVRTDGAIVEGPANPFEHPRQSAWRAEAQEAAWDMVWWRRIWYFVSVIAAAVFALLPFRGGADQVAELAQRGGTTRIIRFIGGFLPDMASPWVDYYSARPRELLSLLATLALVAGISTLIQIRLNNLMRELWGQVMARPGRPVTPRRLPPDWLSRLRAHRYYHGSFAVLRRHVVPAVFAAILVMHGVAAVNRGVFEGFNLRGGLCAGHAAPVEVPDGAVVTRTFATSSFCYASGLLLTQGKRYQLTVMPFDAAAGDDARVTDGGVVVPSPRGFAYSSDDVDLSLRQRVVFAAFGPFRRVWRANWFTPIARVGQAGVDQMPLFRADSVVTPRLGGELFLFVNDAIAPLASFLPVIGWNVYYTNNHGTITVRISVLPEPPVGEAPDHVDANIRSPGGDTE
jgi:hypothetical protein